MLVLVGYCQKYKMAKEEIFELFIIMKEVIKMGERHIIERRAISDAILKGSRFLLSVQNDDGGIEFEDEKSERSGIWVTAEALEFFLTSQIVSITVYEKVMNMIGFLLNTQNDNGSWNMLVSLKDSDYDNSSIIATGHCLYVLRLAISDDYMPEIAKINEAILKAEKWLLAQKIEKNKKIYWAENAKKNANPDKDMISRMEVIFTSYYALLGILSSYGKFDEHRLLNKSEKNILKKILFFFEEEAKWFIDQYQSKVKNLAQVELAKILSTFSRITNAIFLLNAELGNDSFEQFKEGLLSVISSSQKNACFTSTISVGTLDDAGGFTKIYNNNTPFDVGMALLRLEDGIDTIVSILDEYLINQMSDGSWYLNFTESYKVKTWSTAEALICLEQVFEKYDLVSMGDMETYWKKRISNIQEKLNKEKNEKEDLKIERDRLTERFEKMRIKSRVFMILLAVILIAGGCFCVKWITNPENAGSSTYNLLAIIVIPFIIGTLANPFWNWLVSIIHKNPKQ